MIDKGLWGAAMVYPNEIESILLRIEALHNQLEKARTQNLHRKCSHSPPTKKELNNLRQWGIFARQFRSDEASILESIDLIKDREDRLNVATIFSHVSASFYATANENHEEYEARVNEYRKLVGGYRG